MKKFLTMAFATAVLATPALAQTVSTTTPPATSGCAGNTCPGTLSAIGLASFGGVLQGGFGVLDTAGNLVAGNGITGKVEGDKRGEGSTVVTVKYNGPGCALSCGSSNVEANVTGKEVGWIAAMGSLTAPGSMLTIVNSGALAAGAQFSLLSNPGQASSTHIAGQ